MSFEAIVLAGGLGTRLRSVVADVPKVLAPIDGRPFIDYLLERLMDAGCSGVVLATGYKRELVVAAVGRAYRGMPVRYSEEDTPLGTGGAVVKAFGQVSGQRAFVLNGDTWIEVNYRAMMSAHIAARAEITMALTPVEDVARYGAVVVGAGRVTGFIEKNRSGPGLINGGVYVVERHCTARLDLRSPFSFEQDLLTKHVSDIRPLAFETRGRFIDIGIPQDYAIAKGLLSTDSSARTG